MKYLCVFAQQKSWLYVFVKNIDFFEDACDELHVFIQLVCWYIRCRIGLQVEFMLSHKGLLTNTFSYRFLNICAFAYSRHHDYTFSYRRCFWIEHACDALHVFVQLVSWPLCFRIDFHVEMMFSYTRPLPLYIFVYIWKCLNFFV